MCHSSVLDFMRGALSPPEVYDKSVLEVGSLDVNGSVRPDIEAMGPESYLGIDIVPGPGVDQVARLAEVVRDDFDIVVCCEVLEHVEDWRAAVSDLKRVTAYGGTLIVTTRSRGFPYHAFPIDAWRYEIADMMAIFSDFSIGILEHDPEAPGVFMKAYKPIFVQKGWADLSGIELYQMSPS
jgi:SAM-dependent methyltransferase